MNPYFNSRQEAEAFFAVPGNYDIYAAQPGAEGLFNVFRNFGWNIQNIPAPPAEPVNEDDAFDNIFSPTAEPATEPVTEPAAEPSALYAATTNADKGETEQRKAKPVQQPASPVDGALMMAARGVALVRLMPRDKKPISESTGWQNDTTNTKLTTDPEIIRTHNGNFGCGAIAKVGGPCFFEIDSNDVLERITKETGHDLFGESDGFCVRSRKGRGHFYYAHTEKSIAAGNISQTYVQHQDWSFRGDGQFVVTVGSIHPTSGLPYELMKDGKIPPVPDWLVDWMLSQKTTGRKDTKNETPRSAQGLVPHGSIHGFLVHKAGKMREAGLEVDEIESALLRVAHEECEEPIDETKVRQDAQSMGKYPKGTTWEEIALEIHINEKANAAQFQVVQPEGNPTAVNNKMPDALHADAYYGIVGRHLRNVQQNSEAHPAGVLALFLAAFGSMVGRNAFIRIEDNVHFPIVNVLVTGKSSRSRKDTAMGRALRPLKEADVVWRGNVHQSFSSGEALVAYFDRLHKQNSAIRLFVTDTEFKTTLTICGRQGNTLSEQYRRLFNGDPMEVNVKNGKDCIYAPSTCGSVGGLITLGELLDTLKAVEIESGFVNRFLTMLVHRVKKIARPVRVADKAAVAERLAIVQELRSVLAWLESRKGDCHLEDGEDTPGLRMSWSDEAGECWDTFYNGLGDDDPDYLNRAEVFVLRLTMIYALLDKSAVMRLEHLKAALAVWHYAQQSAELVYGNPQPADVTRLLTKALAAKAMKRGAVSNFFGRNKNAEELDWVMEEVVRISQGRLELVAGFDRFAKPQIAGIKSAAGKRGETCK